MTGHSRWLMYGFDPCHLLRVIGGHKRSNDFLPITFDRREIKDWGWSQCVSLAKTHHLICKMTYLGHHVTSRDLELRSHLDITFYRSTFIYFDASRRDEHDGVSNISLALLIKKLFAKKMSKTSILTILDLCSLTWAPVAVSTTFAMVAGGVKMTTPPN